VVTDNHVAVIDGSTSKALVQLRSDMRNGKYAMLLVREAIMEMDSDVSLAQFCQLVTAKIAEAYIRHGVGEGHLSTHPEDRLTASVCVFSLMRKEIWMIGDCQCLCNGILYENPKPHERPVAEHRSAIIRRMISSGTYTEEQLTVHDYARDQVVADIVESCHHQNKDFSVVDGFPIALDKTLRIDASDVREIVMSTDGYPFLKPTLAESEAALAHQLSEDPLCYKSYLATKGRMQGNVSFDDRAYVRFLLKDICQ